jgi:hypothetical protein
MRDFIGGDYRWILLKVRFDEVLDWIRGKKYV